nr:immunoglobulin light chain junction region [Macaca mulatta]
CSAWDSSLSAVLV